MSRERLTLLEKFWIDQLVAAVTRSGLFMRMNVHSIDDSLRNLVISVDAKAVVELRRLIERGECAEGEKLEEFGPVEHDERGLLH